MLDIWSPLAGQRERISSFKRTGENGDHIVIPSDKRMVLMHLQDVSGYIQRFWMTTDSQDPDYLKKVKISMIFNGRYVLYRWHLHDPIIFYKSLHASIEAGHANECEQHYESVSFWYGLKTN